MSNTVKITKDMLPALVAVDPVFVWNEFPEHRTELKRVFSLVNGWYDIAAKNIDSLLDPSFSQRAIANLVTDKYIQRRLCQKDKKFIEKVFDRINDEVNIEVYCKELLEALLELQPDNVFVLINRDVDVEIEPLKLDTTDKELIAKHLWLYYHAGYDHVSIEGYRTYVGIPAKEKHVISRLEDPHYKKYAAPYEKKEHNQALYDGLLYAIENNLVITHLVLKFNKHFGRLLQVLKSQANFAEVINYVVRLAQSPVAQEFVELPKLTKFTEKIMRGVS